MDHEFMTMDGEEMPSTPAEAPEAPDAPISDPDDALNEGSPATEPESDPTA